MKRVKTEEIRNSSLKMGAKRNSSTKYKFPAPIIMESLII
uniref:Uncharacterized protein n=1 Tax=Rhizophora mucronata TaxID=61149 RepID=A0A2P2QPP0_RHIMU